MKVPDATLINVRVNAVNLKTGNMIRFLGDEVLTKIIMIGEIQ